MEIPDCLSTSQVRSRQKNLVMNIRTRVCYEVSRRKLQSPAERTVNYEAYKDWRHESLSRSWSAFDDAHVTGKDVLDFGCGDGELTLHLAKEKFPRSMVGVEINTGAISRAQESLKCTRVPEGVYVDFIPGKTDALPVADQTVDTVVAFDCLEHVMAPGAILREWFRVLRPGGRCLVEWFPYKGPWGPHMEALIPIPWAHILFGERAMFRTAELIYDLPNFIPRHWDLDELGHKKPNKWRTWSSFEEQGYINKLDISAFRGLAHDVGFEIPRLDRHSFGGSALRQHVGRILTRTRFAGEYFVSFVRIELLRAQ